MEIASLRYRVRLCKNVICTQLLLVSEVAWKATFGSSLCIFVTKALAQWERDLSGDSSDSSMPSFDFTDWWLEARYGGFNTDKRAKKSSFRICSQTSILAVLTEGCVIICGLWHVLRLLRV